MAYEYDRFEREDGGGAFLMGLLAGTVLGAGLGMLFAPKAGAELRTQLQDSANKLQRAANEGYQQASEKVTRIVEKGREAYDRARTGTEGGIPGRDEYGTGQEAVARGSEEFRSRESSSFGGTSTPGGYNPSTPGSRTTL
jgi:gas vesicle protein